jgi:YidC/Oxa1 family membrane protein insertase
LDRNLILAFALSMAVFSGWLAWQENVVAPERRAAAERALTLAPPDQPDRAPPGVAPGGLAPDSGSKEAGEAPLNARDPSQSVVETGVVEAWEGELSSDVARVRLSNRGGTVSRWWLSQYFETPKQEVTLDLIDLPPGSPATFSTPFEELGLGDLSTAMYEVERADSEQVVFLLRRGGVEIRKRFSRPADDYTMDLEIEITNVGATNLAPNFGILIPAAVGDRSDWKEISLVTLAGGEVTRELVPSVGSPGFFDKMFGDGDQGPTTFTGDVAWAGLDMSYFAGLLLPANQSEASVALLPLEKGKTATARLSLSGIELAPGESTSRLFTAFFGPKEPAILAAVGDDLEAVIGHAGSWVGPLTNFFGWALHRVHGVVPNYGLAIIILTIMVRLATWPIMARQMKSAEKMRELMPRIKELQAKYKDDRQKQSEETFKLYRETGVNPLGGCLPMVLQLPVFIGLFYALQSSIDLRQAPFFLWINDLSQPATLFTLPGVDFPIRLMPVLMGASMYVQQKMMPQAGMDPTQAKMMAIMMPGMMLVISYTFPSGLVLYWLVSNLLGIGHQLYVRSRMQAAA